MTLLSGCIFGLIRWAVSLVKGVAMWTLRQIIIFIFFALPHAIGLIFSALWWALKLSALPVISLFTGFTATVGRLAEHWLAEALAHGFPPIWEVPLYNTFYIMAVWTILAGWAIILFTAYVGVNFATHSIFLH